MNTDYTAKITETFYSVNEFCKQIEPQFKKKVIVESTDKCKIKQSFCSTLLLMFQTFVFAWCNVFLLYTPIFWFIRYLEWCIYYQKAFFESAPASHLSLQHARVARASAVFRFLPSPLHHTTVRNYETATCGWRLHSCFLHRWRRKKGISFTRKTHCINELRVKVKGEGRNCELAECAMCRGVSVRTYGGADEETEGDMVGEGTGVFSKKAGRKKRKEGAFRTKVHKFLFELSSFSKNETFFSQNLR